MQRNKIAGLLLISTIILASCSNKGPKYTKYIPKDASYVLAIDVKGLVGKLEKDGLKVEDMMSVLRDSSDPSKYSKAMEIWQQFKDAGLDWDNKVMIAVPMINMNNGEMVFEVVAGLKDAGKLQEFIGKLPGAPKVQKDGDLTYASNNELTIGWKDDAVMILAGQEGRRRYSENEEEAAPAPAPVSTGGMVVKMKKYFSQGKDESMASVKEFGSWVTQKADIGMFTNSTSMAAAQGGMGMALAMMPKVKDLMEGVYSTTTVNFEEGKVVAEGETHVGKKLAGILSKYNGNEVDYGLVENYPSSNVNGVIAFSFKPEVISDLLTETGTVDLVDGQINNSGMGITRKDILMAFKGDFAVIASDFTMEMKEMAFGDQKIQMPTPDFKVLGAIKIGDKTAFDKILAVGEKTGLFQRQGNRLVINPQVGAANVVIGIENDRLVIANKPDVYAAYVAKSGKITLTAEATSAIKGKSVAAYVNAESILKGIPETMFDSTEVHEKKIWASAKETFKDFHFEAGKFSGNSLNSSGAVTVTGKGNSLSQLVRFLMIAAEEMKQKEKETSAAWDMEDRGVVSDTAVMPIR